MKSENTSIRNQFELLDKELTEFIRLFENDNDYTQMIYKFWNAKDVLGHITFWHESFARNISDISTGQIPNPLKGKLSEVNKMSIESNKGVDIKTLIQRLKAAQKIIENHIYNEDIELIPYKKGSRDYSRSEHLEVVTRHIDKHLNDLKKIVRN